MSRRIRQALKFRVASPAHYLLDLARSPARPLRLLLASDRRESTSEQQFAPLETHRSALRNELGLVFHHLLIGDVLALPARFLQRYDAVLFKLSFRTPEAEAVEVARRLRAGSAAHARLLYCDGDDDPCVLWPDLLPHVDLYVKKHMFADPAEYARERVGKTNLTDYVARTFGTSFTEDIIPSSRAVPAEELHKIHLGWNIGLDDKIRILFERQADQALGYPKDIDVVCRAKVPESAWIHPLRAGVVPHLRRLEPDYKVLTPEERVSQEAYYEEMKRSRVCVSPFGYGEICWRDFEAVLCGCLLVKPDMGHIRTRPDIFVANETYLPVRWDFADLEDTLRRCLEQPEELERMRRNALETLVNHHRKETFLDDVRGMLEAAGLRRPEAMAATSREGA